MIRKRKNMEKSAVLSAAMLLCCSLWVSGCSVSARVSTSHRSAIEQMLLARSLERSIAQLNVAQFSGKTVALEVYGLTRDAAFAEELIAAGMQEQGLKLASNLKTADLRIKVFLTAFGIDTGVTLVGLPAIPAPVINVSVPEIALFKSERNRGHTQLRLYAFDESSQKLVERTPLVDGRSKFDDYKILLLIRFAVDDLDETPAGK
jgi:hypothetical protein